MAKYEGLDCILLVDDDEATNFIHKMVIEHSKIEAHVETCDSALKALDYLSCQGDYSAANTFPQPGIIFLDINMPVMNGWEFLEAYEKLSDDKKAQVVVAMLTTSLNPDDQARGEGNENIRHFKNKPLTVEILREVAEANFKKIS